MEGNSPAQNSLRGGTDWKVTGNYVNTFEFAVSLAWR
jgi:hypothetical protein